MAKSKTGGLDAIEPAATYFVVLTRSVRVGRAMVHPGPRVEWNGETLEAKLVSDADAIASYTKR